MRIVWYINDHESNQKKTLSDFVLLIFGNLPSDDNYYKFISRNEYFQKIKLSIKF